MLPQAHIATRCGPFKAQAFSFPRAPPARERCQTAMSNGPYPVARMSGAISGYDRRAFMPLPDFTAFIRATKKKGSGTPANAGRTTRTHTAGGARHGRSGLRRAVRYGRARLPAFHLGSAKGTYVTQGATQAMLPGTRSERVLPAFACPSPVSTSHAGR